jgi:hypothetical protein
VNFVGRILGYEGEIRNRYRGVVWGKFGIETGGVFGGKSESEPGEFRGTHFGV